MSSLFKRPLLLILLFIVGLVVFGVMKLGPIIYRITVGMKRYEAVPPTLPATLNGKAILIFSKTNGYREDEQIKVSNAALSHIAAERGWSSFVTENGAVFNPEQLKHFRAVVWNNVSGDVLTESQRESFKTWLEQGGGFVGLHGAGGDPKYSWRWYVDDLIGAQFIGHTFRPHFQQATIVVEDPNHPAMRGLGPTWVRTDEWYSFAASPRLKGYRVLATLDERTYHPWMRLLPFGRGKDVRMGADHPIVWSHCVGNGRALYSGLGHAASTYSEPKHLQMIAGAISWAAGFEGPTCVNGVEAPDNPTGKAQEPSS
jgi:uncharacterized protein